MQPKRSESPGLSLVLDPAGNPHLSRGGPAEIQRVHPGSAHRMLGRWRLQVVVKRGDRREGLPRGRIHLAHPVTLGFDVVLGPAL
jgi:hypothetical protein